jgi:hypothetical protein
MPFASRLVRPRRITQGGWLNWQIRLVERRKSVFRMVFRNWVITVHFFDGEGAG